MPSSTRQALPNGVSLITTIEVSDVQVAAFLYISDERAYLRRDGDRWYFAHTNGVDKALDELADKGLEGVSMNAVQAAEFGKWIGRQSGPQVRTPSGSYSASTSGGGAPRSKRVRLTDDMKTVIDSLLHTGESAANITRKLEAKFSDAPSYQTVNKYVQGKRKGS